MADLVAKGPGPQECWQKSLPNGEVVRLGRAPRHGLKVGWDMLISREHAELLWKDDRLTVKCLETARNPVYYNEVATKEFSIRAGETFRIGSTWFLLSITEGFDPQANFVEERAFGADELRKIQFRDTDRQLDFTSRLPEIITNSKNDEDFAVQLASLMLEALPRVQVAAVVYFADLASIEAGKPTMMRWDSRSEFSDRFRPSRKMMAKSLIRGKSLLKIWSAFESSADTKYTMCTNLDWAICTPITNESSWGWCLYVAGESTGDCTAEDLKGDLKFISMMAEFIGAIREVRRLEKLQANMSQFFSVNVLETLNADSANMLLKPSEREITVLFCDVRGFSRMTEQANSNLLFLLDRVIEALSVMTRGIVKYDGIVSDFQGDAALGFWGWPVALIDGPLPACQAALTIQNAFADAARSVDHPLRDFVVGIGVAHGRAIAGRIGSDEQAKIGVFGPPVNLGARLEGLTKQLHVKILVDDPTAAVVRSSLSAADGRVRRIGRLRPVGLESAIDVSELLPGKDSPDRLTDQQIEDFETAVDLMKAGDWERAGEILGRLPDSDGPRQFLMQYMAGFDFRPPADWDGVIHLTQK
ncbi:MAG: hypothetical protein JSS02_03970 [Planctomycetes bacterium]|nr:hypothetical protein [Planctomycetota bacterium]